MATFGPLITTPYQVIEPPPGGVSQTLKGVLLVEGTYLEPTIGQIWPR